MAAKLKLKFFDTPDEVLAYIIRELVATLEDDANNNPGEARDLRKKIHDIAAIKDRLYYLDFREHATVLAGLRYWQSHDDALIDDGLADIASDMGTVKPLDGSEIDALCERINH